MHRNNNFIIYIIIIFIFIEFNIQIINYNICNLYKIKCTITKEVQKEGKILGAI